MRNNIRVPPAMGNNIRVHPTIRNNIRVPPTIGNHIRMTLWQPLRITISITIHCSSLSKLVNATALGLANPAARGICTAL